MGWDGRGCMYVVLRLSLSVWRKGGREGMLDYIRVF